MDGDELGGIDLQEAVTTTLESLGSLPLARRAANSASSSSSVASSSDVLWRSHAGEYRRQLCSSGHRACMSFVWAWIRSDRVPAVGGVSVSVGPCPLNLSVTRGGVGLRRANAEDDGAKTREAGRRCSEEGMIHAAVEGRTVGTANSRRSKGDRVLLRRSLVLGFVIIGAARPLQAATSPSTLGAEALVCSCVCVRRGQCVGVMLRLFGV